MPPATRTKGYTGTGTASSAAVLGVCILLASLSPIPSVGRSITGFGWSSRIRRDGAPPDLISSRMDGRRDHRKNWARIAMSSYGVSRRHAVISSAILLSQLGFYKPALADELRDEEASYKDVRAYLEDVDKLNIRVPDFKKGLEWINTGPVSLVGDLRGKLVLLDFWTYCCINCMHILPSLATLEKKYANEPFAVVGVHSAKFANEKQSSNIRAAVEKYNIQHPVVNDKDLTMWNAIGVSSWPTQVLLGPRGNILSIWSGEGYQSTIDNTINEALAFYREKGALNEQPFVPAKLASTKTMQSQLRFPGKVAFTPDNGGMLAVSDSANNRIIFTTLEGKVLSVVGGGSAGLKDGNYKEALFNSPQGLLFYDPNTVIVADTENHAVRRIDLQTQQVKTLAGNGNQGFDYNGGGSGAAQTLSSPWDIAKSPDEVSRNVLVAMAGTHQIWAVNVDTGKSMRYSGTGRELHLDSNSLEEVAWAQPSGLALNPKGDRLAVADSESITVRVLSFRGGNTFTVAGGVSSLEDPTGRNLFAFGDKDGVGTKARFQHPLGITWLNDDEMLVADTYNHKLKRVSVESGKARTWMGSGRPGSSDGRGDSAQLWEPSGVAFSPELGVVFVADTNNHAIRKVDVATDAMTTLPISFDGILSDSATVAQPERRSIINRKRAQMQIVDPIGVLSEVTVDVSLPEGYHFTKGAPSRWQLVPEDGLLNAGSVLEGPLLESQSVRIPIQAARDGTLELEVATYFCQDGGACRTMGTVFTIPVKRGAKESAKLTQVIPLPAAPSLMKTG